MTWQDTLISIVIPTYKRPDDIVRALRSVDGSTIEGFSVEIVVADNDPLGSAQEFVTDFAKTSQTKTTYIHVPEPGVSNARNGALEVAEGRYILFLDDDMEAGLDWAKNLFEAAKRFDVTLAFGPIDAVMPDVGDPIFDYMQPIFSRHRDYGTGLISETIATGNSFIDRHKAVLPSPVFDPSLNKVGGEDNALFYHIIDHGATVAWVEEAHSYEHVPAKRATLKYVWKRNFAWGQGPTKNEADKGLAGIPGILKWMIVGAAQIGIYGVLWATTKLTGRPKSVKYYGRLAQGFGKVLWSERLSPKLYGV